MSDSRNYQKRRGDRRYGSMRAEWKARRDDLRSGVGRVRFPPMNRWRVHELRRARYLARMATATEATPWRPPVERLHGLVMRTFRFESGVTVEVVGTTDDCGAY